MSEVIGWLAAGATVIAGLVVAGNLGARITGWGFVLFAAGSLSWIAAAAMDGNSSLLLTNLVMTGVNLFGVWRWLGRQARLEQGSLEAMERSREAPVPALVSVAGLIGSGIAGLNGCRCGTLVDLMLRCDRKSVAYVVFSSGGVGGVGEHLHAVPAGQLSCGDDGVICQLTEDMIAALPEIDPEAWPETAAAVVAVGNPRGA